MITRESTPMVLAQIFARRLDAGDTIETAVENVLTAFNSAVSTLKTGLSPQDTGRIVEASCRWLYSGCSSVRLGHRLAASLGCTRFPSGIEVVPPWDTFSIQVPDKIISDDPIEIFVSRRDGGLFCFYWLGLRGPLVFIEMDEGRCRLFDNDESEFNRIQTIVSRIIVGAMLEIENSGAERNNSTSNPCHNERQEPKRWTLALSRPVKLDLRKELKEFVAGSRRGSLSMQHLVRGHWKNQPHGKEKALRRWIHVEPYWRGDPNAPIAVRSHNIGC